MINFDIPKKEDFLEIKKEVLKIFGGGVEISLKSGQKVCIANIQENERNKNKLTNILQKYRAGNMNNNDKIEEVKKPEEPKKENSIDKVFDGIFFAQKPLIEKTYIEPIKADISFLNEKLTLANKNLTEVITQIKNSISKRLDDLDNKNRIKKDKLNKVIINLNEITKVLNDE